MSELSRREWLTAAAAATAGGGMVSAKPAHAQGADRGGALRLAEFEPRSMLQVPQSAVEKARFPVIDFHTHLSWSPSFTDETPGGGKSTPTAPVEEVLPVMDRQNLRLLVNVTGGYWNLPGRVPGVLRREAQRPFRGVHRALVVETEGSRATRSSRLTRSRRRTARVQRAEGPQGPWPLPEGEHRKRPAGEDRRQALRPDVGGGRGHTRCRC